MSCAGLGKNSQSGSSWESALEQHSGRIQELWVHMHEPGLLVVLEAQRAETSPGAPGSTTEKVAVGAHCWREAVVFSGTYRNRDCVFWRVQRRAD